MTNKYAEGYPGKRYYGGCEFVDVAETLAIERARKLFGAEHANVQTHAGAQANMAVLMAVLQPGDTLLGMSLAHGGHLTHGTKVSFSGKLYNAVAYGVRKGDELIDFDQVRSLAREHKPKLIIAGASAYPRTMEYAPFREIADEIGATFPGRHGAHRRARRDGAAPVAGPARRLRHLDNAQDAARPAWRPHPHDRGLRAGDRQERVPRHPRRTVHAYDRRQSRRLRRGARAVVSRRIKSK